MTSPSRYAVALDALDRVRVSIDEQVEMHVPPVQVADAARWGGCLPAAFGDSASAGGGGAAAAGCDGGGGE